jgi:hypothetical protein
MAVAVEDEPLFKNEDWVVMQCGLEHRKTGYFIARDEVGSRRTDGLWSWPLHVAEKNWCSVPTFMEAFSCAVAAYGVPTDMDFAQSFHVARREIATAPDSGPEQRTIRAIATEDGFLQPDDRIPISWKPVSAGRSVGPSSRSSSQFQDRQRLREPVQGNAFPLTARARLSHPDLVRATRWRATRRIRRAGTRIVRLLRAAWNIG